MPFEASISNGLPMNCTVCSEKDFLPVSKFSKYHSHLVCSNENFIVYTPSKRGIVRVIRQEDGSHLALTTDISSNIKFLHLWETNSSSSLLAIGSEEGKITIWEIPYLDSDSRTSDASSKPFELRQTLSLSEMVSGSNFICKSISKTRYLTFCVRDSIYFYRIPEGSDDQSAAGRSAVIQFDSIVTDFSFLDDGSHLAVCSADQETLWLFEFSLAELLDRKFTQQKDLTAQIAVMHTNISRVWFFTGDTYANESTHLLIESNEKKKMSILDYNLTRIGELDISPYVSSGDECYTQFDSLSNVIFFGSSTPGAAVYFISLGPVWTVPRFTFATKLIFPETFHPLGYSVSMNFDNNSGKNTVVDLYTFHTRGLAILPVTLQLPELHQNKESIPKAFSDADVSEKNADLNTGLNGKATMEVNINGSINPESISKLSTSPELNEAIEACLTQYKTSSNFPGSMSTEIFDNIEKVLLQSGILKVLSNHIALSITNKFERRILDLEFALINQVKSESLKIASNSTPNESYSALQNQKLSLPVESDSQLPEDTSIHVSTPESNSTLPHGQDFAVSDESGNLSESSLPKENVPSIFQDSREIQASAHHPNEFCDTQDSLLEHSDSGMSNPSGYSADVKSESNIGENEGEGIVESEQNEIQDLVRELTYSETLLLAAIEQQDLSEAVRIATSNVSSVSLTHVLDIYVSGDCSLGPGMSKELRLFQTLLIGDALVLLSFIAVLSSDLTKNEGAKTLASCMNWLLKLIVTVNDNFPRYTTYSSLISQIYMRTKRILLDLPSTHNELDIRSLIQELDQHL